MAKAQGMPRVDAGKSGEARWQEAAPYRYVSLLEATLVTTSPLSISTGDADATGDQPLLRDAVGRPYIPATGFVGALRQALSRQVAQLCAPDPLKQRKDLEDAIVRLIGVSKGTQDDAMPMGQLYFDDLIPLDNEPQTERRDHVRIDPKTGVAKDKAKFDRELLAVGSRFRLRIEWRTQESPRVLRNEDRTIIVLLMAILEGQASSPDAKRTPILSLGGRTRRGLGQVMIAGTGPQIAWRTFDLGTPTDLHRYILDSRQVGQPNLKSAAELAKNLDVSMVKLSVGADLKLRLDLQIAGSLLIRGPGRALETEVTARQKTTQAKLVADASHLRRPSVGAKTQESVISATALAGVLRHRAEVIVNTLTDGKGSMQLVEELFGASPPSDDTQKQTKPRAGHLCIAESVIRDAKELRHTRVCIDPWTGGALDSALFTEDALYGGRFSIELRCHPVGQQSVSKAALGLLFLALRDLWEGDLSIGAESSVGRGFVRAISGALVVRQESSRLAFRADGRLEPGPYHPLIGGWVAALQRHISDPSVREEL